MAAYELPGEFLYLDESGDLGVSDRSTPVFVIALLHLRTRDALGRVIKRARRKGLGRGARTNELKWSNSGDHLRAAVIAEICAERRSIVGVSGCVIHKTWFNDQFRNRHEEIRYNYAVRFAMEKGGVFLPSASGKRIEMTIDARNRRATERMRRYLEQFQRSGILRCVVKLDAANSARLAQLQAADFVAGAIYSAYAHNDWRYLDRVRSSGIEVRLRVPRKKKPAPRGLI